MVGPKAEKKSVMHARFLRNPTPQLSDFQIVTRKQNRGNISPDPPLEGEGVDVVLSSRIS